MTKTTVRKPFLLTVYYCRLFSLIFCRIYLVLCEEDISRLFQGRVGTAEGSGTADIFSDSTNWSDTGGGLCQAVCFKTGLLPAVCSGGEALDECGLRYLLAVRLHTCLLTSLPPLYRMQLLHQGTNVHHTSKHECF